MGNFLLIGCGLRTEQQGIKSVQKSTTISGTNTFPTHKYGNHKVVDGRHTYSCDYFEKLKY